MTDSKIDEKNIPLIYASKAVLEAKAHEASNRAVMYYTGSTLGYIATSSLIAYVGYLSYTRPIHPQLIVHYALFMSCAVVISAAMAYMIYSLAPSGKVERNKYLEYNDFIKKGIVDLTKMSELDVLDVSMGSFIELSQNKNPDTQEYKKLYAQKISRLYPIPKEVSNVPEVGKKPYFNILPYTHEYLEQQKNGGYFKILREWGPGVCLSTCTYIISGNILSLSVAALASVVVLLSVYNQYQQGKFWSSLASNVDLSNDKERFKDVSHKIFQKYFGVEYSDSDKVLLTPRLEKSYETQNTFNRWLDRLDKKDNAARSEVINSFIDLVNQRSQGKVFIN